MQDLNMVYHGTQLVEIKLTFIKWVALSHNLLKHYDYGDTILVTSTNPNLNGKWVVMDKMHKRHHNRIDFLSPSGNNLGMLKPINLKIEKL